MKENEKVLKALTDEELMALEGGFLFKDLMLPLFPINPIINLRPPVVALYAVFPILKKF